MEHKIKNLPQSQIEIEVNVPVDEMAQFWNQGKKSVTEKISVKGFRPGKAPESILADKGVQEEIYNEVINAAVKKTYLEIINKEGLEPIGNIDLEVLKIAENNEFVYKIKTAVLPKIELADYKAITKDVLKDKKEQKIDAKEMEEALNWLVKSRAQSIIADRACQMGDVIDVSLKSFDNDQEIVGGSFADKFILGEGHLMPGLEKAMEGMKAGDEKKFELTAPKDYWDENLRNKKISFEVKVNSVFERKSPEVNDEWAKSIGHFDDVAALNESIKDGLLYEKNLKERDRLRILITDKIVEKSKMDLPEILISNEVERRVHQVHHLSEDAGMSFEDYLKRIKKTEESLKEELKKESEKDLRVFLILREISQVEKCEPTNEELETAVDEIIKSYPKETDGHNHVDRKSLFEYAKERLTNEKVFQFLESL